MSETSNTALIQEFWAVTKTSIYHVQADGPGSSHAEKIALVGKSKIGINERLYGGHMVAICKWLQAYVPEGTGGTMTTDERQIDYVNTAYWGANSSEIVGLFLTQAAAEECLSVPDRQPCDPRWLRSTDAVLAAIGPEHPSFCIAVNPGLALRPTPLPA